MILVSAYFSGSETGMMTLNRYRLRHKARSGNRAARRVEKLLRRPDRLISLVLIGNNFGQHSRLRAGPLSSACVCMAMRALLSPPAY